VAYTIVVRDDVRKALGRLDPAVRRQVGRLIDRLADNPRPGQATRLVSDPGTWRVKTGDWRILYEIHDDRLIVLVIDVQHRRTDYRRR
jgi:mRNA interferase RelE/StbE